MIKQAIGAALAGALILVSSCDVNTPDRFVRAPVIKSFFPKTSILQTVVGDTLRFSVSAIDPDANILDYSFVLGDSAVADSSFWEYVVEDTGEVAVRGLVSNRVSQSGVVWSLQRMEPVNLPPVVTDFIPANQAPSIIVGDAIEFAVTAVDPEGEPLSYVYAINDTVVTTSRRYTYQSSYVGPIDVKAVITDGENFTIQTWDLNVSAEPDSILPATVTITSVAKGMVPGELFVDWIAVGNDSMEGVPSHYEVRTSSQRIADEAAWNNSSERLGAPPPANPGEPMTMVVQDLKPANVVFVAVRAVDDFGNLSPLGNSPSARSKGLDVYGNIRDAADGQPISGVIIRFLSEIDTTDANGDYALTELPEETAPIFVSDELDSLQIGNYFNIQSNDYTVTHLAVRDFWLIPNLTLQTTAYANFLFFVKELGATPGVSQDLLDTFNAPIDIYVPPLVQNGLDFEQVVKDVVNDWESLVGIDLFQFVGSIPPVGVFVEYDPDASREEYELVIFDERKLPVLGKIVLRTLYSPATESSLRAVTAHEVGHSLGMHHSADPGHLMVGFQAPPVLLPTIDEILLCRVMYRIPRGYDLDQYRHE